MERPDVRLDAIIAAQHGAHTLAQARDAGLTDRQIHHRAETGRLTRIHRGTYITSNSPATWIREISAQCAAANGIAARTTAAALHGMWSWTRPVHVICDRHRRRKVPGVISHEQGPLPACDLTHVLGIPTTTPTRTLLDMCAVLRHDVRAGQLVDAAIRERKTSSPELRDLLTRVPSRGTPGKARLRRVLDARHPLADESDSWMETLFLEIVAGLGLPDPEIHVQLHRDDGTPLLKVDCLWRDLRIIVELDSAMHRERERFNRDRAVERELEDLHWRVRRFTYAEVAGRSVVEQDLPRVFALQGYIRPS